MTVQEFSDQFDVLVSSYRRFKAFDTKEELDSLEFNEYEKSVFLTQAQKELVLSLYTGRNSSGNSFEETEELRRYLASQVEEASLSPITTTTGNPLGIDSKSKFFTLPEDLWFITYEAVKISNEGSCNDGSTLDVVPVTQDEYHKVKRNPFRGANNRRALRLDLADDVVEIVCKYTVTEYYVRYLKKLEPIVLVDMPHGITIEGVSMITECMLNDSIHHQILEQAVALALQSKLGAASKKENENN